nr:DNA-binding protein [Paenibacillus plantiphilus]
MINAAVDSAIKKHSFSSSMPPLLTRTQLMELLEIGSTKTSELLGRNDFPVCREFGNPRVPTHLLMKWIDEHTEWINNNAGTKWKKGGAA